MPPSRAQLTASAGNPATDGRRVAARGLDLGRPRARPRWCSSRSRSGSPPGRPRPPRCRAARPSASHDRVDAGRAVAVVVGHQDRQHLGRGRGGRRRSPRSWCWSGVASRNRRCCTRPQRASSERQPTSTAPDVRTVILTPWSPGPTRRDTATLGHGSSANHRSRPTLDGRPPLPSCMRTAVFIDARPRRHRTGDHSMIVTMLGTGSPLPDPERAGPATLVQAGGLNLLVDCGTRCLDAPGSRRHPRARVPAPGAADASALRSRHGLQRPGHHAVGDVHGTLARSRSPARPGTAAFADADARRCCATTSATDSPTTTTSTWDPSLRRWTRCSTASCTATVARRAGVRVTAPPRPTTARWRRRSATGSATTAARWSAPATRCPARDSTGSSTAPTCTSRPSSGRT